MSLDEDTDLALAATFFSEIVTLHHQLNAEIRALLPSGLELSHFAVLNVLVQSQRDRNPAELARLFHVSRPAMTNTISRLDAAGYVHIRPDWEDGRRKFISITRAGREIHDQALRAARPVFQQIEQVLGDERMRQILPMLRLLRHDFELGGGPKRR